MRALLLRLGCLWLRSLRIRWSGNSGLGVAGALGGSRGMDPPVPFPRCAVFALWHEHLPACIPAFSHRGIDVLISRSADGAWAAEACERFGYRVHRGSTTRGSMGGMRDLARGMGNGTGFAGMALDGPRGPRRVAKPGSVWLANLAGAPVLPVWIHAPRAFRLGSWDRCLIPLPFSRVEVRVGEPFHPRNAEDLTRAMDALAMDAKGREPPDTRQ